MGVCSYRRCQQKTSRTNRVHNSPTTEKSIEGMELALKHGEIKQCISDRGSQFMNNMEGYSRFQEYLAEKGIQHIKKKCR